MLMKFRSTLLLTAAFCVAGPAFAQQTASNAFNLGQIETVTVTGVNGTGGAQITAPAMSSDTLSTDTTYTFHDTSLNQALDLIPGVAASNSGGSRNEQLLFVHGFDRFETPISIDGIRVYLPADNRLDFARFLTGDLSEIQVAKGYVSVLNGPGAMGGAINLVTRKPTSAFNIEAQSGLTLGQSGSLDTSDTSLSVGTKQDQYYLQASTSWTETSRTELSDDYIATATQPRGFRLHSQTRDFSVHLKAGWTPNETDEYSISYLKQTSGKQAPFSVSDPVTTQRDWTWPYWDLSSVYFLSNTALGDSSYVKTKAYYNTFTNGLFSYDNANYNSQSAAKAFRSYYDDYAYGGSIEMGTDLFAGDTIKGSFLYRRDDHDEQQQLYSPNFLEPHQVTVEDTYSLAAENTWHAASDVDLVAGVSYDWRNLLKAQDFVDPTTAAGTGTFINYTLKNGGALNGQAALIWNATENSAYYANVSDRTRFPTIFERFSTRFGTAASNPGLKTERAANFEIGTKQTWDSFHFDGSVFYSDVTNAIEAVVLPLPAPAGTTQSQNVGHGAFYGAEVSLTGQLTDDILVGGNYTYQIRHIHTPANVTPLQLTGDPGHKGNVYVTWNVLPELSVTPNLQLASNRWTANTAGTVYFKTGSYALGGISANYRFLENFDINAGVKNLFDQNYQLVDGFPAEGRTFFLQLRFRQ
jgi:iron complex outermembrane receptor protein